MRRPFEPIGDQARWRTVYDDLLKHRPVDAVITYRELADALDLHHVHDRNSLRMAMRRAAQELEESDNRAVEAVRSVGYRIVLPQEHLRLARRHQKRSTRSLARGHSKVVHVDLRGLEPEHRKALEVVAQAFCLQMDFNRRFDVRQKKLEVALRSVETTSDRTVEEVAELRERLARLERATAES